MTSPGTEAYIDFFKLQNHKSLYLVSSPEFALKKILCLGLASKVFEIKKCFRDSELGPLHKPEFYMLEWYRKNQKEGALIKDIKELFYFLKQKKFLKTVPKVKIYDLNFLFKKHLGFDLKARPELKDLKKILKAHSCQIPKNASLSDLFFILFLSKIEPKLYSKDLIILKGYPEFQRAYSQLDPQTGFARRFELYWQGVELANSFYEITCPLEQKKVFKQDIALRKSLKKDLPPIDEKLLKLMPLPECSGIALGLDRLFMLLKKYSSIQDF